MGHRKGKKKEKRMGGKIRNQINTKSGTCVWTRGTCPATPNNDEPRNLLCSAAGSFRTSEHPFPFPLEFKAGPSHRRVEEGQGTPRIKSEVGEKGREERSAEISAIERN